MPLFAAVAPLPDDAVTVDVDITPLPTLTPTPSPTIVPTPPVGGSPSPTVLPTPPAGGAPAPSPSSTPDLGWLAGTGAEPAWLLIGAALVLVAVGVALIVARRRRVRS
ncbi:hypothetical protein [Microbacterium sp. LMI1-1-1.1]|uniref:hypothetical protein n=1 Tax=unclassified Microbacterium TaxID=2609290 RepID=UPI00346535EF